MTLQILRPQRVHFERFTGDPSEPMTLQIDNIPVQRYGFAVSEMMIAESTNALVRARAEVLQKVQSWFPENAGYEVDQDLVLRHYACPICLEPMTPDSRLVRLAHYHLHEIEARPCGHVAPRRMFEQSIQVLGSLGTWHTYTTDVTRAAWTIEFRPHYRDNYPVLGEVTGVTRWDREAWTREHRGDWSSPDSDPMGDVRAAAARWRDWRDFANDTEPFDAPLSSYTPPPPDQRTGPSEAPPGDIGYAPSIVDDVERCWRCVRGAVVEEDLGLCQDCITTLREASDGQQVSE